MIAATAITRTICHGAGSRFGIVTFRAKALTAVASTGRGVKFPRRPPPRRYGPRGR